MSARLPARTWLYFIAQSINLTTAVMAVTIAALVGAVVAPRPWMATLPYGGQFLVVMLATLPVARLMRRHGRKRIFLAATLPLALAGITGYLAVQDRSFGLLIVSHALLGLYIAVANFSRFAATDGLSTSLKPRAMSLVIAGGVVAAFTGPSLVNSLREWAGIQDFALCYAAFAGLAVLHALTILPIRNRDDDTRQPVPSGAQPHAAVPHPVAASAWQLVLHDRPLVAAMLSAAVGYGLMNLLMIQSSMNMTQLCMAFSDVNRAIQWHVLAMFLPSFVTGSIIQRVGTHAVIVAGFILIGISAAFNMDNDGYALLSTSLILLGLGWNFTYIGGSAMLNERLDQLRAQPSAPASAAESPSATRDAAPTAHRPDPTVEVQGINDLGIAVMATLGAFLPAPLMSWPGWAGSNLLGGGASVLLIGLVVAVWRRRAMIGPGKV